MTVLITIAALILFAAYLSKFPTEPDRFGSSNLGE